MVNCKQFERKEDVEKLKSTHILILIIWAHG